MRKFWLIGAAVAALAVAPMFVVDAKAASVDMTQQSTTDMPSSDLTILACGCGGGGGGGNNGKSNSNSGPSGGPGGSSGAGNGDDEFPE